MIDRDLRRRFEFFREEAGYIVGRRAAGALALAKAERWLEGLVCDDPPAASREWGDDGRYDPSDVFGPYYCLVRVGSDTASLSGVDTNDDPYARVVEAELALELMSERERRARNV